MSKFKKKFGFAFPEFVQVGKRRKNPPGLPELRAAESWEAKSSAGSRSEKQPQTSNWRLASVYFIFVTGCLVLAARALDLQVIQGGAFLGKSEGNHIRLQVDHSPRGVVFDRNGKILAQNIPGFRLVIDTQRLPGDKRQTVLTKLSSILGAPAASLEEKIKGAKGEVTLVGDLAPGKALVIEAEDKDLPGLDLEVSPIRNYPYKEITANILGYTAEVSGDDLAKKLTIPYSLGDKVGKAGVEASQEEVLRGTNGYQLIKVTANGENKGEIYQSDPRPGQNIALSIDIDLQQFIYQALQKKAAEAGVKKASAVVLDPSTGEILALVSLPSYDDNIFAQGLTDQEYQSLVVNPDDLLLNRAIGAAYPPGSTFKMATATAGLETGAIGPQTKLVDPGYVALGNQVFENWLWREKRKTEGAINVARAMARSTDTFFYLLGQMVGEKAMAKYAGLLGLGQKTGIELTGETAGLIPTDEWKLAAKGEAWYPGDTINMSIGQGDVLVSPLQLTVLTAVFANGGELLTPTILKSNQPKVIRENFLKKETVQAIRDGLYQDTVGDGNVGWLFGSFKIPSAGKTGSAESEVGKPFAWYTAYAPVNNPKIVVTVQAENAGHGADVSAPVVKEIFEWWFSHRN